jgi:hypothetical protein
MPGAQTYPFDHFMLAAPDLEAASMEFERCTGVRPSEGGRHRGQGSRNMLATLGAGCYLEIIGPDLSQERNNNLGAVIAQLPAPTLLKYALRTRDIEATNADAVALGLWPLTSSGARAPGPFAMSRALPEGGLLTWRLLLLGSDSYADCVPFFIQWDGEPHPSKTAAAGCGLKRFWVEHPDAPGLAKLYAGLGVEVDVVAAGEAALKLTIGTPEGDVTF